MMSDKKVQTKKSTKWQPRQRRVFSEAFKREKVTQITSGQISLAQFSKLWGVSPKRVYRWIYQYSSEHQKGTVMAAAAWSSGEYMDNSTELPRPLDLQHRVSTGKVLLLTRAEVKLPPRQSNRTHTVN